jgi:ceramide glucosyltransferase
MRSALFIAATIFLASGWVYWLLAWWCARSVLRRGRERSRTFAPFVSILKPVKGLDEHAAENFASFCNQAYDKFEILFGVADRRDPAVPVIEQLQASFPNLQIRLLVSPPLGINPKAATLHHLTNEAKGDVLVMVDSDIRVTSDYLRRVVAPLEDRSVGAVTCLYRGQSPNSIPAKLEALYIDATFSPSAALAYRLAGTRVGLGATIVVRREELLRAGGYAAIADYLMDDYLIVQRVCDLGLRVHLSDYVVASVLGNTRLADQWGREVRWSRGVRVTRPWQYPGLLITFSVPLSLIVMVIFHTQPLAWAAVAISLLVRWWVAWRMTALLGQQEHRYLLWLPVRDCVTFAVWLAAFFGRTVRWRGDRFRLHRDGRLSPLPDSRLPQGPLARAIRALDAWLRARQRIFEFGTDEKCILRASVEPLDTGFIFPDGTHVPAGERVGVLHLWNERMPFIPPGGPDLAWGIALRKGFSRSMVELARAAQADDRLRDVRVFGAVAVFVSRNGEQQIARMAGRYGFEWCTPDGPPTFWKRFHDFWENFLIWGLQWAYNPAGLRGKGLIRPREPIWITRETLLNKYGSGR